MKEKDIFSVLCQENTRVIIYINDFFRKYFDDFAEVERKFNAATCELKRRVSDELIDELVGLKNLEIIEIIKYEILLGIKANYDYFTEPHKNDFLSRDIADYTKDRYISYLPCNEKLKQDILVRKHDILKMEQYDALRKYFTYHEVVCPKLAHLYGYIAGNSLLSKYIVDYKCDYEYTDKYIAQLEDYFGIDMSFLYDLCVDYTREEIK